MRDSSQIDRYGDWIMSIVWRKPAATLAERTRRRVSLHLVPVLFILYILAFLDRVNVSVAQLSMKAPLSEEGLSLSKEAYGFGFGIFFIGYWILEIPSTLSVVRWGARWVFCRILILWGLCATLMGIIGLPVAAKMFGWLPAFGDESWPLVGKFFSGGGSSPDYQFFFLRFMLGLFEGGFFPSVIVYLSYWFRPADRGKAIATFMAAIPISMLIGSPISGLIKEVHWLGLAGWRWIFILEGIAPILAGVAVLFCLPNRPKDAKWLTAEERDWLLAELDHEHQSKQGQSHVAWKHHLGIVLLLTVAYFGLNMTSYSLNSFMPQIIKAQTGSSDLIASTLTALPYLMALVVMLINGWHSDRTGERPWHAAVPVSLLSLGIFLAAAFDGVAVVPVAAMIFLVGAFLYAHLPAYWPIPTTFLGASAAAGAIGFINMIGTIGGFVGPYVFGSAEESQGSFAHGLLLMAPWPFLAGMIVLMVGYIGRKRLRSARVQQKSFITAEVAEETKKS